jgi:hypothetical protein
LMDTCSRLREPGEVSDGRTSTSVVHGRLQAASSRSGRIKWPLALGVIDFEAAAALGFLFNLAVRAAEDFQGSLDLLGLRRCHGGVSKRESAACKCSSEKPGGPADD